MEEWSVLKRFIKRVGSVLIVAVFVIRLSGCAALAPQRLAEPTLQGRLEGSVYTSPPESFRIRIPWLSTNATLRDETSAGFIAGVSNFFLFTDAKKSPDFSRSDSPKPVPY
jgi:hypothetical protein